MKKTGSVAAALLLASSLAACNSSTDKTPSSSASAEPHSTVTGESSSTVAGGQSSAEAANGSSQANIPSKCQKMYSLLQVGDTIKNELLYMCTRASLADVKSAHLEYVQEGPFPRVVTTGSVVRDGEDLNFDLANQRIKARRVGGQYWLDVGNGWQETSADHLQIDTLLMNLDVDDLFKGQGKWKLPDFLEYNVTEVSDEGWNFELSIGDRILTDFVNKDYYLEAKRQENPTSQHKYSLRISGFNEPVSVEPPM